MTSSTVMALSLLSLTMVYVLAYAVIVSAVLYICAFIVISIMRPVIKYLQHD